MPRLERDILFRKLRAKPENKVRRCAWNSGGYSIDCRSSGAVGNRVGGFTTDCDTCVCRYALIVQQRILRGRLSRMAFSFVCRVRVSTEVWVFI